jgi:cysteine desulfurase
MARLLHCRASEIVFTSGGTESDNLALFGVLKAGDHLITSAIEHHAVLHAAEELEKRGVEVTYLPCDDLGLVSPESLRRSMRPNTRLVSVMLANNETGTIQPVSELARVAREHDALFHTDAVQAAGKLPLDLSAAGALKEVDLLSIAGHKMYAPQGTGVLFVRRSVRLRPIAFGGTHERQRRAGTENVAGIVALGKAAELHGLAIPTVRQLSRLCAIAWKRRCWPRSRKPASTARGRSARRTPPTSTSITSKPRRW